MFKRFYLLIVVTTGYFTIQAMEDTAYEEMKKESSVCTAFGIDLLQKLELEYAKLQKQAEISEKDLEAIDLCIRDAEQEVILNSKYDEMEIKNKYCKRKNLLHRKQYISIFVWQELLAKEKRQNSNLTISDGSVKFESVYHAALFFDAITTERKKMHEEISQRWLSDKKKLSKNCKATKVSQKKGLQKVETT